MIPLALMAAGSAVSLGGSIAKAIGGAKRASKMRKAIANYNRQSLDNAVRGKVGVSREGAELQAEEMARSTATAMDALAKGGVRGVVGGVGQVQQQNNVAMREISSDLDRQKRENDIMAVQDDVRIRQMQETREQQDLAGMGQELNAGRQDMYSGIGDIGQSLMSMGGMADMMGINGFTPKVNPANAMTSTAGAVTGPSAISQLTAPMMPNSFLG